MTNDWRMNYCFHLECGRMLIHILVIMFGVSTWIGVNGIFIELPLLVDVAPEGWNLPAYIVIVAQSANIGPAIYTVLRKKKYQLNESSCILSLLCSQVFAMGLLVFFYDSTITIDGEGHSFVLLASVFFNALVGCFSSVLFMPYLRDFDHVYIVSYFVGEGLSGVLPSVVALIQGVGERAACNNLFANATATNSPATDLTFSGRYYFLFLTLVLVLSLVAFVVLRYSSFIRINESSADSSDHTKVNDNVIVNVYRISDGKKHEMANGSPSVKANNLFQFRKIYLYVLIGICCFFSNGFLPSVQSYSCLPYGYLAYQLSIICAQFVNPLACFLTIWVMVSDIKIIHCLSLVCLMAGCYVICMALLSPTPLLQKSTFGVGLIVLSWIILTGIISYLKLVIVSLLKHISSSKALFNIGIVMQTGSAAGAVVSFILLNYTDYFETYDFCSI